MADERVSRRNVLFRAGGLLAAGLGSGGWKASSDGTGPGAVESGAVRCVLAPEQTDGPFYIAKERVRRNITDGKPGTPMTLRAVVVDASTCKPIRNATVDVWHCDAAGDYSGFGGRAASRTFLRGMQKTNAKGVALFQTIYPGWYPGRTVHVHVKVHLGGNVVHTGQLYFPDAVTDTVYRQAPYSSRPGRSTRNPDDAIFRNGGKRSLVTARRSGSGYAAAITMGVHRR